MRRNKQLALNFSILRIISKKMLFSLKENDFVGIALSAEGRVSLYNPTYFYFKHKYVGT